MIIIVVGLHACRPILSPGTTSPLILKNSLPCLVFDIELDKVTLKKACLSQNINNNVKCVSSM